MYTIVEHQVGNTFSQMSRNNVCSNDMNIKQNSRRGMTLKHLHEPHEAETHKTKSVLALIQSRQLGGFLGPCRVCPKWFPGVSEGFRTTCIIIVKNIVK